MKIQLVKVVRAILPIVKPDGLSKVILRQELLMLFNWKLESIKRMFGLKKSNKGRTARKLNIENLEERIECATKVWNGSLAGVGTNGTLGPPPEYGVNGDPTFSSFMASIQIQYILNLHQVVS